MRPFWLSLKSETTLFMQHKYCGDSIIVNIKGTISAVNITRLPRSRILQHLMDEVSPPQLGVKAATPSPHYSYTALQSQ